MQGDAIVKRILSDAKNKADEVVLQAEEKAKAIVDSAKEYSDKKQNETAMKAQEKSQQIFDRYETLSRIEGNKILLNKKQNVLKDLKNQALDVLLGLDKKEKLKLIEKLIKDNAEKEETVLLNVKGLTISDVEELKVVKSLSLKVEKNKVENQIGIILSSKTCDKNLLFADLIENAFENNQLEINRLLFKKKTK